MLYFTFIFTSFINLVFNLEGDAEVSDGLFDHFASPFTAVGQIDAKTYYVITHRHILYIYG